MQIVPFNENHGVKKLNEMQANISLKGNKAADIS